MRRSHSAVALTLLSIFGSVNSPSWLQAQSTTRDASEPALTLGLYGGSFSESDFAKWHNGGRGFELVQTYWGPSYPTVDNYVAFIGRILENAHVETAGKIKLLVDVRGVVRKVAGSVETPVRVGSWGNGFQTKQMYDEEVDLEKLSALLKGLAALPHADLIEGLYITDENLGRYMDVEATISLASKIKEIVKQNEFTLSDKIYVNFAGTNPLSATHATTGNLYYEANPEKRDRYNVNGQLATAEDVEEFGYRGYGMYGPNIDVVMINWFGDRINGSPTVPDGARQWRGAKTGLDIHLHRIQLDYPGEKHLTVGYGESAENVAELIENVVSPQTPGYDFQFQGVWIWAWYGINNYQGQTIPAYRDAWGKRMARDLRPVIERFRK